MVIAGHASEALLLLKNGYDEAKTSGNRKIQRLFLASIGSCQFTLRNYPDALSAFLSARALSEDARDDSLLVSLNANISGIYLQMNNLEEARASIERALAAMQRTGKREWAPHLRIQLARVLAKKGQDLQAEEFFWQGISEASERNDWPSVALGLDCLGDRYRARRLLDQADAALTEAFRLRKILHLGEIESSYLNLARLRSDQGDLHSAGILMDRAVDGLQASHSLVSNWSVYYERGRVRLAQGELAPALADFRTALDLVTSWRRSVIPTDENRMAAEAGLQQVYSALIEAGNRLYFKTGEASLSRETFDAAEDNRAASLRALVPSVDNWRAKLPSRYWELLPQLQTARRALVQQGDPGFARRVQQIRTALTEMEFSAGAKSGGATGSALEKAQAALDRGSVLLSFHLGDANSWLWAVSSDRLVLYQLKGRAEIGNLIQQFAFAPNRATDEVSQGGEALYRILFGQLHPVFRDRRRWLVSLDEDLFPIPFAALVVGKKNGEPVYLGETHEIQITSGALMLRARSTDPEYPKRFIGVGDPIYNTADPRWRGWGEKSPAIRPQLARLPGTGQELRESALVWSDVNNPAVLLTGADANKHRLWQTLAERPAVIHFATHVLEEERSGAIALSLTKSGVPEYLGAAEITPQWVPASLIVLSGCSSGKAEARPGTGLMGLTRAWIAAGADTVLATHWTMPDDSGPFLVSFYRHLRQSPQEGAAGALRAARLEMIGSGSYRARPGYWAAYFLVGNS
ncbi:MAG: CHAT domain-containing tetratricopeptide repeat protein [Acidobacteriota bacterium]|nr:CHAT domain-containing tetratricopeptide repeat protein [Acidobacteriota bacterium]